MNSSPPSTNPPTQNKSVIQFPTSGANTRMTDCRTTNKKYVIGQEKPLKKRAGQEIVSDHKPEEGDVVKVVHVQLEHRDEVGRLAPAGVVDATAIGDHRVVVYHHQEILQHALHRAVHF